MTDEPNAPEQAEERPLPPDVEQAYRRLSRRAVIVTSLIVIVVLTAAAFIGTNAISRRFEGARNLDTALDLLEQADEVVLDVDEVVRSEVSTALAQRATQLITRLPGTRRDLERAERLISGAMDSVTEDEQRRARLLRGSVLARLEMLDSADAILDANIKAGLSLAPSQDGWTHVLAAEKLADESVREYNKLTQASVRRSSRLVSQATSRLKRASPYFSQAATAFPEAGFDKYIDFIDEKVALLALSEQSNKAWLAGNVAAANAAIRRYNTKEKAVLALATALPPTPGRAVASAYEALAGEATKDYDAARKKATEADARLDAF